MAASVCTAMAVKLASQQASEQIVTRQAARCKERIPAARQHDKARSPARL
ncbi:MAG: hypothetical protein JO052_18410 [Bradyrhizobium sp.]|nr:hypothetical protein [Bradyrhizobium sp.]